MGPRLELASEFESGFSGIVDLNAKWLFNFIIVIVYYLFFKASDIDADRDRSVFDKILYFRILVPYTGIIKNVSKNTEALICPESLFKKKIQVPVFMDRIYRETGHF